MSLTYYPGVPGPVVRPLTFPPGGGVTVATVVNQWAGTFTQPTAFGTTPSALQSTVIALDSGTSVGGGSGTPTAGNWLFCITGMNEQFTTSGFTVGDADDIHSWWRPAKVSTATALTRCSVWYTPNLARVPGDVYTAPNGCLDGAAVLVVEVSGIGPWDVVTVSASNYAAGATSLNLATAAPSAASFMLAAVVGDNSSASQAFAPSGWTTLYTMTATNGTNHVSDVVLTSAYLASNTGSSSVNGTASSAEDLSGVIIGVELSAPSPIPSVSGVAPGWPGRMIVEAALGAGFETPQDELTWTVLNDSAIAPGSEVKRFWGWADQSGIPYALAQLQSSTGTATLDNADGALTPSNSASSYYPDITTGTPIRLRVALGTLTGPLGSTVVDRWYVVQRNMLNATERRDSSLRNFVDVALTDIWSVAGGSCPTPYRGEVLQDNPYAWWPADDQPGAANILPVILQNAAPGNASTLNIELSPNGAVPQDPYNTYGYNLDVTGTGTNITPTAVALYTVSASSGWMYGDPQSSPASNATGNPVTASPGSAAWQQTGVLGDTGSYGWFLACNDASFPALANGITVEGWFNYTYYLSGTQTFGHSESSGDFPIDLQQPYCPLTLWEIATASAPVAVLQFTATGTLELITYNGGTGTAHTIYSATDLRNETWRHFAVTLTTTTWNVLVDGGQTANISGTATGMTSAWTWFLANGDLGSSGGSSLGAIQHGGNVQVSHLAIYPSELPPYRIMAHYMAAVTGFGLIPTPTDVTLSWEGPLRANYPDNSLMTDGSQTTGRQAYLTAQASCIVTANIGAYTSGPSAWVVAVDQTIPGAAVEAYTLGVTWTGVAPAFGIYTGATIGTEANAATACGNDDWFYSGLGGSANGFGIFQTASGTGASAPATASAIGDTVSQGIERRLAAGGITYPGRAVDTTPNLIQAGIDVGGQQVGANVQNLVQSDNGWWFTDAPGNLNYRAKAKLAADTVVWNLSSAGLSYGYPFQPGQTFNNDPTKVWNIIQLSPYSPDNASLPLITPTNASAVNASQSQCGPRPLPWNSSYLQSSAEILASANWLIAQYGTVHRRVESLTIDAAGYPPAWLFVLGCSPGDLVQIVDQPLQGGPQSTGTYRISSVSRRIYFGANGSKPEGSVTVNCDAEPTSYYT